MTLSARRTLRGDGPLLCRRWFPTVTASFTTDRRLLSTHRHRVHAVQRDLSLTRSKILGGGRVLHPDKTLFRFRYERRERDGTKDSTSWGDTNLVGTFGTRSVVPAFWDWMRVRIFSPSTSATTRRREPNGRWARVTPRRSWTTNATCAGGPLKRPIASSPKRTRRKNDIFAVNGFYLRQINEQLTYPRARCARSSTRKSRAAGSTARVRPRVRSGIYSPPAARRRLLRPPRRCRVEQTVLNLNAVYVPIRTGRFDRVSASRTSTRKPFQNSRRPISAQGRHLLRLSRESKPSIRRNGTSSPKRSKSATRACPSGPFPPRANGCRATGTWRKSGSCTRVNADDRPGHRVRSRFTEIFVQCELVPAARAYLRRRNTISKET